MLWVDKYRPKTLDKMLIVHQDIALNLKKLVSEHDCPHLLCYGPPGAGKKTLIMALLKQMSGPSAEKAGTRTLDLELTTLSSTHHVELNPSDAGFQDSQPQHSRLQDDSSVKYGKVSNSCCN